MRESVQGVSGSTVGARLFTVRQVAAFLNVSEKTVRRLIVNRQLRCIRIGRLTRIDPGDVSRWLSARKE